MWTWRRTAREHSVPARGNAAAFPRRAAFLRHIPAPLLRVQRLAPPTQERLGVPTPRRVPWRYPVTSRRSVPAPRSRTVLGRAALPAHLVACTSRGVSLDLSPRGEIGLPAFFSRQAKIVFRRESMIAAAGNTFQSLNMSGKGPAVGRRWPASMPLRPTPARSLDRNLANRRSLFDSSPGACIDDSCRRQHLPVPQYEWRQEGAAHPRQRGEAPERAT